MSLTDYRTLGRSGLVVSPLALGTMTFGTQGWGADDAGSRAIFDAYRAQGGNFVDTADIYSGGASEEMVGRYVADAGVRDEMVLATKFAFNGSGEPAGAVERRGGKSERGRRRRQEHPPGAGRVAAAAAHRLRRPLLDAHLGTA